jgi:outer membrane protein assembly factor BamB
MNPPTLTSPRAKCGLRWWPALVIAAVAAIVILVSRWQDQSFQQRNLWTLGTLVVASVLLLLWWLTLSRAGRRLRLTVAAAVVGLVAVGAATLRLRGVSGDLMPILEPRWVRSAPPPAPPAGALGAAEIGPADSAVTDFPQFLGPRRNATVEGLALAADWDVRPPIVLWRQPVGAGWSGFAVVGDRALTQEQRGDQEAVTCYDLRSGQRLWAHTDAARYATTIAGEGPRCTPTVVSNRVFTLGATGLLNCLELASGRLLWQRSLGTDAGAEMPEWGFAGSPLVLDGLVMVSAGGAPDRSVLAYRVDSGELAWAAGSAPVSYSSPIVAELAGERQILAFNGRRITAHRAADGAVLWEYPWGIGQPHVAVPVPVGPRRVVFSSGYGVGAELLEIAPQPEGSLAATRVWQSRRMKAKFANLVVRDGFLYGLDDGIFACLDLADGSQRWKEGRYGHGQGLLVGEHFLLMAEQGELVLLRPTPEAPNELHRFRVFRSKTWNPIALAGEFLLVRNDLEAACLRITLARPVPR